MNTSVSGKSALVTGGTSGLGRAIALALAGAGCRVTAAGLTEEEVTAFPRGPDRRAVALDVTDDVAVRALAASFERLDILVNSAGIIRRRDEFQIDAFENVVDVNLTGAMRVCVACHGLLTASRGCVVNIGSMLSFFGSGVAPAYSASKGGVAQLTKSLAIAWAGDGIRVNAVAPGWVRTPLTQALQDDPAKSRAILERTPLGRWGEPEEIAPAVLFLCSPAAAFITGAILPVDGGYSAM